MGIFVELKGLLFRPFAGVNDHCRWREDGEWVYGIIVEVAGDVVVVATDANNVEEIFIEEIYPC